MEFQDILVGDELFPAVPFNEPKSRKIIQNLPPSPFGRGRKRLALFQHPHLLERERIAFDRGRAMGVPYAGVLLKKRNP